MKVKDLIKELEKLDGEKTIGCSSIVDELGEVLLSEDGNIEIIEGDIFDYVI